MTPELRAIADRFMYETATLKHLIAILPEGALDRPVPGYKWNVRQLLAHLAESLHTYCGPVERWLRGDDPLSGWDPDAINADTAERHRTADAAALIASFDTGIVALVGAFASIPEEKMHEPFGATEPLKAFHAFEGHCLGHAVPLIDAVTEVRMDPLVLNWLLFHSFEADADRAWQRALLQEAREYAANHPEEDEE